MIWLYVLISVAALFAAWLWVQDYQETHPRSPYWGVAPNYQMSIGRHRA